MLDILTNCYIEYMALIPIDQRLEGMIVWQNLS